MDCYKKFALMKFALMKNTFIMEGLGSLKWRNFQMKFLIMDHSGYPIQPCKSGWVCFAKPGYKKFAGKCPVILLFCVHIWLYKKKIHSGLSQLGKPFLHISLENILPFLDTKSKKNIFLLNRRSLQTHPMISVMSKI